MSAISLPAPSKDSLLSQFGQAKRLFDPIFDDGDNILIRPVESHSENGKKQTQTDYKNTQHIRKEQFKEHVLNRQNELSAINHTNLFFSVCPRFGPGGFDLAWQIRKAACLWADIDDSNSIEDVLDRCKKAGLPSPSAIVSTGRGFHLYWFLDFAYLIDDVTPPPKVITEWVQINGKNKAVNYFINEYGERVNLNDPSSGKAISENRPDLSPKAQHFQDMVAGIAKKLGSDKTFDLSRLLRIPGTMNRKDERNGREPIPCTLIECSGARYSISQFEQFADFSPDKRRRDKVAKVQLPAVRKLTPAKRDKLSEHVLQCQIADDRSREDFRLCCFAISKGIDRSEVWGLVSGVGKFEERGEAYFELTWSKAANYAREQLFTRAQKSANHQSSSTLDSQQVGAGSDVDTRPLILLTTDESAVNDAAISSLVTSRDVFHFGSELVRVICDDEQRDKNITRSRGTPHAVAMENATLSEVLSTVARFGRENAEGEIRPAHLPDRNLSAIRSRKKWPRAQRLTAILSNPILRHDGSIFVGPGYDLQTEMYTDFCGRLTVPDHPMLQDARTSIGCLSDLVQDFPFDMNSPNREAWIAGVITPIARPTIDGPAPGMMAEANTAGTGKTLSLELISGIVTGREFSRHPYTHDDAEMRKVITTVVERGLQMVLLDNIDGSFGLPSIDAALTGTSWTDRRLGKNESIEGPLRTCWYLSGNNITIVGDAIRRILRARMLSKMEHPEDRTGFKIPDIRKHVLENRNDLLSHVFTILRAYILAGMPDQKLSEWGSFESWSRVVRGAIVWAGMRDPGETRIDLRSNSDRKAETLARLIAGLEEITRDGPLRTDEIISTLQAEKDKYSILRVALSESCGTPLDTLPDARQIGSRLGQVREQYCGTKFIQHKDAGGNLKAWFVVNT